MINKLESDKPGLRACSHDLGSGRPVLTTLNHSKCFGGAEKIDGPFMPSVATVKMCLVWSGIYIIMTVPSRCAEHRIDGESINFCLFITTPVAILKPENMKVLRPEEGSGSEAESAQSKH